LTQGLNKTYNTFMLTKEDIAKLVKVLATKESVEELKSDVQGLRESIQMLTISVDVLSKSIEDLKVEYVAVTVKLQRHEKWIQKIAEKIGVGLDY
jgi:hypothetical protein